MSVCACRGGGAAVGDDGTGADGKVNARLPRLRLAGVLQQQIRRLFTNHDGWGVGVARRNLPWE